MTESDKIEQVSTNPDKAEKVAAGPDKFLSRQRPPRTKLNRWRDLDKVKHDATGPNKVGVRLDNGCLR